MRQKLNETHPGAAHEAFETAKRELLEAFERAERDHPLHETHDPVVPQKRICQRFGGNDATSDE